MLICSCRAVSERTIRDVIAAGARTPKDIARACGAGSDCGGCWPALTELLEEHSTVGKNRSGDRAHTAA